MSNAVEQVAGRAGFKLWRDLFDRVPDACATCKDQGALILPWGDVLCPVCFVAGLPEPVKDNDLIRRAEGLCTGEDVHDVHSETGIYKSQFYLSERIGWDGIRVSEYYSGGISPAHKVRTVYTHRAWVNRFERRIRAWIAFAKLRSVT